MKLICSQTELNTALQLVSRAVAARPTHPVLANILLTADQGTERISLTGFDLNLGIQTSIPANVETSGAMTLPAKLFGEIISKLSSEFPITITTESDSNQINLMSQSGTYNMKGMNADDFPELPLVESGTSLKIKSEMFANALRSTLFASSSDESKQLLTGVNLTFNGGLLKSAATDGHRLSVLTINNALQNISNNNIDTDQKVEVTLPSRSLREVERFISMQKNNQDITLFYDQGQVVFIASDQIVTTRTLEGLYPNYSQLIPQNFSHTLEFDKKSLVSSLERIAVVADQHNNVIKICCNESDKLAKITADAQDVGSGSESIPFKSDGQSLQIAFNVRYVLDGLKVIQSDRVYLRCNAPTTPAIFSPVGDENDFIYLVMPVQVRSDN